jgi:hypothetical protein
MSLTLIHVFLQIGQKYWCLCLIDVWHESLQLMEGIDKPHTDKYKEITNNWNYDASCTLTSLPRKFEALDFCCTECTYRYHWALNV